MEGFDGIMKEYPQWYFDSIKEAKKNGTCRNCGKPSKKANCSTECNTEWKMWSGIQYLGTTSVRKEVHKNFGFTCQSCGEVFMQKSGGGILVPRFYGHCHHVIWLENGGPDSFDNLTLLCEKCHKEVHRKK